MKRYLETLLRYWYLVLIPIILFPAGELALLRNASKTITASRTVYVALSVQSQLDSPNPYISPADNLSAAIAQLLQSQDFASGMTQKTPHLAATEKASSALAQADFVAHILLQSHGNYLTVSYTTRDRVGADAAALEVVDAFLSNASQRIQLLHQGGASQSITTLKTQLRIALAQQARDEKVYGAYLQRAGLTEAQAQGLQQSDPTVGSLIQQVTSDAETVKNLHAQLTPVQQSVQGHAQLYSSIDRPTVTSDANSRTKQIVSLGIAAVLGIVLAALFVVLRTALDRTIRFPSEVARLLDLPVLTVVPFSRQPSGPSPVARLTSPSEAASS